MNSKIKAEIDKAYAEYEKKIKPLKAKQRETDEKKFLKIFSKHKGIIYLKSYGKGYKILKVLKSVSKRGRFQYTKIVIEETEDYSVNYIKERNAISKVEAIKLIKKSLREDKNGK